MIFQQNDEILCKPLVIITNCIGKPLVSDLWPSVTRPRLCPKLLPAAALQPAAVIWHMVFIDLGFLYTRGNDVIRDGVNVLVQRTTARDVCGLDSKPLRYHAAMGRSPHMGSPTSSATLDSLASEVCCCAGSGDNAGSKSHTSTSPPTLLAPTTVSSSSQLLLP